MRFSKRNIRIGATLIIVVGLGVAGVAILAEELGLIPEARLGDFERGRITLLAVGAIVTTTGALLLARPQIIARLLDWGDPSSLPPIDWGRPSPPPPRWFGVGLLAQIAAGALIIGLGIGTEALYWDEIVSVSVAERNVVDIFDVLARLDPNMGLYYFLLHAWMWGGDSDTWIRLLSALPAVAAIPLTALLARRLFGEAVGLVAGFLMVGSMFVVFYAQMARAYPLALLLITVATLLFIETIRSHRPVHFLAYGAVSALAVYASPLSGLVLVAHAVSLASLPQPRIRARPFALTYGGVLVAVAPLLMVMSLVGAGQIAHRERPGWGDVVDTAWGVLGAGNRPLAIAYAALTVIGLLALWRGWVSSTQQGQTWRWRQSLVIGWLVLPPLLLLALSQAAPLLRDRYLLTSAPALAMLAAIGLLTVARRSRVLAAAAAATVICLALLARVDLGPRAGGWPDDDRAAARMIVSESRLGDGIAYGPEYRLSLEWNLERQVAATESLPTDFAVAADPEEVDDIHPREVASDEFVRRLQRHPRVWLVTWDLPAPDSKPTLDAGMPVLRSEYRRIRSQEFGVTQVELYERKRDRR